MVMARIRTAVALLCAHALALDDISSQTLKVRLFWVRHGQSCANVMDRCAVAPPEANALLPDVERALRDLPGYEGAKLSQEFGVKAATASEKDCVVEVTGVPGLKAGEIGEAGAILRAHDAYMDPALTDCSRQQSVQAGYSFIKWLKGAGLKLHFVGSSFLMRAFETAANTFISPCVGEGAMDCSGVIDATAKVTPIPYMTERAPRGLTAVQADNMPRTVEQQSRMIEAAHGHSLPIDSTYANAWPRFAQQYEKFKAFLAVVLAPQALSGGPSETPGVAAFRDALEKSLPETFHHKDHGKKGSVLHWGAASTYETGAAFSKEEYAQLDAPEVNIAIVGHNQMMMEYCQGGNPPKPNNNAVLEKLFLVKTTAKGKRQKIVLRELQGNCAKVMDAPDGKLSMASLTEADVATCNEPFEVSKWIGVGPSDPKANTPCVQLGMGDDAYPIQPEFLQMSKHQEL